MKTLKISILLAALVSVFTFSSCLDNDFDTSSIPDTNAYVTITGDSFLGYTFHADFGCKLKPTLSSIKAVFPALLTSDIKRAFVAFKWIDLMTQTPEVGKTYNIELVSTYGANYGLQTYNTIDTYKNAAADTLSTNNHPEYIINVNSSIWAVNGYVNATVNLSYAYNTPFYINTFFDSSKDIDKETNTLHLNLYYNPNSAYPNNNGLGVFCFKLPSEVYPSFQSDSINLVLNASTSTEPVFQEVASCRIATKDLFTPSNY